MKLWGPENYDGTSPHPLRVRAAVMAKNEAMFMAKPELGTKRIDPETGRKFYDLNKDPIVSPYTGKSYPLSFFETSLKSSEEEEEPEVEDVDTDVETDDDEDDTELVSLEDAEDDDVGGDLPADPNVDDDSDDDVIDLEDDGDEDDTFLADDEDDDDEDVSGIIKVGSDDDEV